MPDKRMNFCAETPDSTGKRYARLTPQGALSSQLHRCCNDGWPGERVPARILVAEDDGGIRRLYASLLGKSGYQVDAVEDGAAAWDAIQCNRYDLLITDNKMPRVSGVELVEMLRSAGMTLSVILVSGLLPMEELERKPGLQLAATLTKPFFPDQFLRTVKNALRGQFFRNFPEDEE